MDEAPKAVPILLQTEVPAGETVELSHTFRDSGIIKRFYSPAYTGEETDVRRYAELGSASSDHASSLFTIAADSDRNGDPYLAGDDQRWDFDMRWEFARGDMVTVRFENMDTTNSYPVQAIIGVDYGGVELIERVLGVL